MMLKGDLDKHQCYYGMTIVFAGRKTLPPNPVDRLVEELFSE